MSHSSPEKQISLSLPSTGPCCDYPQLWTYPGLPVSWTKDIGESRDVPCQHVQWQRAGPVLHFATSHHYYQPSLHMQHWPLLVCSGLHRLWQWQWCGDQAVTRVPVPVSLSVRYITYYSFPSDNTVHLTQVELNLNIENIKNSWSDESVWSVTWGKFWRNNCSNCSCPERLQQPTAVT